MTSKELRKQFLEGVEPFMKELLQVLSGELKEFSCKNNFAVSEAWNLLKDLIKQADDISKLKAESTSDITKLLADGDISAAEAKDLMSILQTDFEMNEMKELAAKLEMMDRGIGRAA